MCPCGDGVVQCTPLQIQLLGGELDDWTTRECVHKDAQTKLQRRELDTLIVECKFHSVVHCMYGTGNLILAPHPDQINCTAGHSVDTRSFGSCGGV